MKRITIIFIALLSVTMIFAQSNKLSPMTRSYLKNREGDRQSGVDNSQKVKSLAVDNKEFISAFVHFNNVIDADLLESYGVLVGSRFESLDIVTARIPVDVITELADNANIRYIEMGTPVYQKMDKARSASGVDLVQSGVSPLDKSYKGRGVIVGVVDRGFQFDHINFKDEDGNIRIKKVWNQNVYNGGTSLDDQYGRRSGVEYSTPEEIMNAKFDVNSARRDRSGHGTHVAGIAAGSYKDSPYYGVAPESDIILVSSDMDMEDVSIANSVDYIFKYAKEVGKPCVINYSLGSHVGPHDGTSTFDLIADELQGEGLIIVGAIGNERGNKLHISKNLTPTDSIMKSFLRYNGNQTAIVSFWGEENKDFTFRFFVFNKLDRSIIKSTPFFSASKDTIVEFNFKVDNYDFEGAFEVTTGLGINNNKPNVYLRSVFEGLDALTLFGFEIRTKETTTIHGWTDGSYASFDSQTVPGYHNGDDDYTAGEIGGVGKRLISVGAYTSNAISGYGQTLGKIATFSSKGPTADGRMKPDIVAPGATIASSLPSTEAVLTSSSFRQAAEYEVDGETYYYGYMQGTSMSSPYVAGTIATWLEADPTLTPERIREIFQETAYQDQDVVYPNNSWGYGKIDALNGLFYILDLPLAVEPSKEVNTAILAYPNPTKGEFTLGFTRTDNNLNVYIYSANGQMVYNEPIKSVSQGTTHQVNLSGVPNGVYFVKVTSEKTNETFRLIVNK